MNFRPVFYVIGLLLGVLAISMTFPMLVDLHMGNADWKVFFICSVITSFFGGMLILTNTSSQINITIREGFLLTSLSWIILGIFAALPFWFSEFGLSLTDAVFEAISGITTTGATVIAGLDDAAPGLLLWRALLQWLGGIGIIVMALSLLPFLNIGGMQLFRTESSENEKALPRAAQLATSIFVIYLGLSVLCTACYILAGFSIFDAVAHAMTTISTGGFSTYDTSFAAHDNSWKELVAIVFMICGALPFVIYLKASQGNWSVILYDSQIRWFFAILGSAIAILITWRMIYSDIDLWNTFIHVTFSATSVMTGTGFSNTDYGLWRNFPVAIFFFLMVVGGCAGSTTCGIKIFRFQVLYEVTNAQIRQLLNPHGVFTPMYNGEPIPSGVPMAVMSFFFVFALCFSILAIMLSLTGLDFITAMSASASAISNVGPGLGPIIGPSGNFASLSDTAKWLLSIGMILGRLELFTILVLLLPRFWRP